MIFNENAVLTGTEILYNAHYVAIPFDCTNLTSLATDGVIPAGTIVPANGATAVGILLHDVTLAENPNGTVVVDGFIKVDKIPTAPSAAALGALPKITFMNAEGKMVKKVSVTYDKGTAASGTAPTDSNSPYAYGATVTVLGNTGSLVGPTGTTAFDGWNTEIDGSGTAYAASDTFTIKDDVTLYAQFKAAE